MAEHENSIEAQAASWQLRRTAEDFAASDASDFQRWIAADPAHAVAFAKAARTWDLMECLKGSEEPRAPSASFRLGRRALAASLIALVGSGALWLALDRGERLSTAVGEQRRYSLADGSNVVLNTDSVVDVTFSAYSRDVTLVRGEAVFRVAKDATRPWRVSVAGSRIEALGTAFAVRTNGSDSRVLMLEGLVKITAPAREKAEAFASAGNAALIAPYGVRVMKAAPGEFDRLLSWRHGMLEFSGQTVQQIADEFNRYSQTRIVVVDPDIAGLKFGGRFGTKEGRQFVEALCSGFPVRAIHGDDGTIYLTGAPAGNAPAG